MNFIVTQFTSYFNDRPKNFTHPECEEHFYPKDTQPTTEMSYQALGILDLNGLMAICILTTTLSVLILCGEIMLSKWHRRQISTAPINKNTQ
jgi:hypothetical protein